MILFFIAAGQFIIETISLKWHVFEIAGGIVLAILLAMLRFAQPITRAIGISGAGVIPRIMGMILCAVAANAILTGMSIWLEMQG